MKKLLLLTLLALAFPASASAFVPNITQNEEHWPTTVNEANDCTVNLWVRCIAIVNRTGYGTWWVENRLKIALAEFNQGNRRYFRWIFRPNGTRLDLNTQAGIDVAASYEHSIVIGYAGLSGPGDWAVTVQPETIEHTDLCLVAIDNKGRVSVEHELGHCLGLTHWSLIDDPANPDRMCEYYSIMCALGEDEGYEHLSRADYRSLDILYQHED